VHAESAKYAASIDPTGDPAGSASTGCADTGIALKISHDCHTYRLTGFLAIAAQLHPSGRPARAINLSGRGHRIRAKT
jgi:hypothetical protein